MEKEAISRVGGIVLRVICEMAKDITRVKKPAIEGWLGSLGPVASIITALGLPCLFNGRPSGGADGEYVV